MLHNNPEAGQKDVREKSQQVGWGSRNWHPLTRDSTSEHETPEFYGSKPLMWSWTSQQQGPLPTRRWSQNLASQIKSQELTDYAHQQLTCELACVHLDEYFLLHSQQSPYPGLFLFLFLNKTCCVLTPPCCWNFSRAKECEGYYVTLERS